MSILQEYEQIRRDIGEEKYKAIEEYLFLHPELFLSDIYYKEAEWNRFEAWNNKRVKGNGKTSYTVCPFDDEAPKSFKSFKQAKQYARENCNVVGYLIKITDGEGIQSDAEGEEGL